MSALNIFAKGHGVKTAVSSVIGVILSLLNKSVFTVWLAFPKSGLKALIISNFHESKEFKKQVQPEIIESWPSLAGYVLIPIWHKSNNESRLNARTSK